MTDREFYKWEIRLLPPTHPHQMQTFVWQIQCNQRCLTAPAWEVLAKSEGELRKTRIQGSLGGSQQYWLQFRKTQMHHVGHSIGNQPVSTKNYDMADEAGQNQRALKDTAPNCNLQSLLGPDANKPEWESNTSTIHKETKFIETYSK